jgi:hypothetical protein
MLEGFERIKLTKGLPSISITNNGITFNKTAIVKLGEPKFVILMKNDANKMLAVQVCDEDEPDKTIFLSSPDKKFLSVRWNNKDLLNTIAKLMQWNLAVAKGYRVNGDYVDEERAMIFDLNQAVEL